MSDMKSLQVDELSRQVAQSLQPQTCIQLLQTAVGISHKDTASASDVGAVNQVLSKREHPLLVDYERTASKVQGVQLCQLAVLHHRNFAQNKLIGHILQK